MIYERTYELKKNFPNFEVTLNGGIKTYDQINEVLDGGHGIHGVMLGRAAYDTPWMFSDVDRRYYGIENIGLSRREILEIYGKYGDNEIANSTHKLTWATLNKPIINLFAGQHAQSTYKRALSDTSNWKKVDSYSKLIQNTIKEFEAKNQTALDERPPKISAQECSMIEGEEKQVKDQKVKSDKDIDMEGGLAPHEYFTGEIGSICGDNHPENKLECD